MSRLLVFNPEHDYALGNDRANYIAPAQIRKLAVRMQWLPLVWADENDYVLLADNRFIKASNPEIPITFPYDLDSVEPWGWDKAIHERLLKVGVPKELMPDYSFIEILRRLSHRRISIEFNRFLGQSVLPREFFETEEAVEYFHTNPGCYFKMPWSAGGRGILATGELHCDQVREWVSGGIRRQGSVIGEKGLDRLLDFASLWDINSDEVTFMGFSVSLSDGRGKYNGNLFGPQEYLLQYINSFSDKFDFGIIALQKEFLKKEISPYYYGRAGVDMLIDREGKIAPCVELNLRTTMGHVALEYNKIRSDEKCRVDWERKCCFPSLRSFEEFRQFS